MNPVMGVDPSGLSPLLGFSISSAIYGVLSAMASFAFRMIIPVAVNAFVLGVAYYHLIPLGNNIAECAKLAPKIGLPSIIENRLYAFERGVNQIYEGIKGKTLIATILSGALILKGMGTVDKLVSSAPSLILSAFNTVSLYGAVESFCQEVNEIAKAMNFTASINVTPSNSIANATTFGYRLLSGRIDLGVWSDELRLSFGQCAIDGTLESLGGKNHLKNLLGMMKYGLDGLVDISYSL